MSALGMEGSFTPVVPAPFRGAMNNLLMSAHSDQRKSEWAIFVFRRNNHTLWLWAYKSWNRIRARLKFDLHLCEKSG